MHVCDLTTLDDSIEFVRQISFHISRVIYAIYAMDDWSFHHTWNV